MRPPLRGHGPHGELRLHAAAQELQGAVPRLRGRQVRGMTIIGDVDIPSDSVEFLQSQANREMYFTNVNPTRFQAAFADFSYPLSDLAKLV